MLWADPRAGYRLSRSRGWSGEAAALDAARLLDTNVDSAAVPDLAGFFTLGTDVVVVRGGLVRASDGSDRYWREALALDRADFERVRCNPFRVLPAIPSAVGRPRRGDLPLGELPEQVTWEDDLRRVQEIIAGTWAQEAVDVEPLLAAIIEGEHTLHEGPAPSADGLELLFLLLPAPLRPDLTFHGHALSTPARPVPRLVLAGAGATAAAFEGPSWSRRLPSRRAEIAARARRVASDLLSFLETPDRLVATHQEFESFHAAHQPRKRPLLEELESVLRFSRVRRCTEVGHLASAAAAIRLVGEAVTTCDEASEEEADWIFDEIRAGFAPEMLGAAVAASFPEGPLAAIAAASVLERFAHRRDEDHDAFVAFTRPIELSSSSASLERDDVGARRLRTLLMLLAVARGDAAGLVAALVVPPDIELIERVGGLRVWTSGSGALADAVQAFASADTPEGGARAIAALGALLPEVPAGRERLRLVELAHDFARHVYRRTDARDWQDVLPLAELAVQLCQVVCSTSRISLDGRPDSEHFHEVLSRSMNPFAQIDFTGHSDAEVFFGFLGADASRTRLARREVDARGGALVRVADARIRRRSSNPSEPVSAEGISWSFALLERIRRSELDPQYVPLATALLVVSAGSEAGRWLQRYFESHIAMAPAIFEHAQPQDLLDVVQLTALCGATLTALLEEAKTTRDTGATVAACQKFRAANVILLPSDVRRAVEAPLRALIVELRENSARPIATHVSALNRALTPIVAHDALPIIQEILQIQPQPGLAAVYSTSLSGPLPAGSSGVRRRALQILGVVAVALLSMWAVLLSSDVGRRALFDRSSAGVTSTRRPLAPETRLGDARSAAVAGNWDIVVGLLGGDILVPGSPDAFAWDSLLAFGALRRAQALAAQDPRGRDLLRVARNRAARGLEMGPPTTTAGDLMRLIRAEACLSGNLDCEDATILVDLALAAESTDPAIARRAAEVVRIRW